VRCIVLYPCLFLEGLFVCSEKKKAQPDESFRDVTRSGGELGLGPPKQKIWRQRGTREALGDLVNESTKVLNKSPPPRPQRQLWLLQGAQIH
jgi:hypothetical protein